MKVELLMDMAELPGWSFQAVHDLEAGSQTGRWLAVGDDPQVLLTPPTPLAAGWYRVSFVLRAVSGPARTPVLYVDYGDGFLEEGRERLAHGDVNGTVSALIRFERPVVRFRFDPSTHAGEFDLSELCVQRLLSSEAAWHLLREERDGWGGISPSRFAMFLRQARELRDAEGCPALLEWVRKRRGEPLHPTRYLRWIRNAEAMLPCSAEGTAGLSVVLLPRVDVHDALAAYASVCEQLSGEDEVLVPAMLAAHLPESLNRGTRIVAQADDTFYGLAQARKPFVTWVGPEERMHPRAIAVVRQALHKNPGVRFAYTDEDFVDHAGERRSPCFKPKWDRELLLAQDYPARSVVLDRLWANDVAERIDGEAWLYGACLEAREKLTSDEILHVPAVTRHHLHPPGPIHAPLHADAVALEAPMRAALLQWREQNHPEARIEVASYARVSRMVWPVPPDAHVDIVIPTRDRVDLLASCVDSILQLTESPGYTLIILDNGSTDQATLRYLEKVSEDPRVRVIRHDAPFNYSAINNYAVSQTEGDIIVLLNNDIEIVDGKWLSELAGIAARPGVGAVGAKLLYPDRSVQHGGVLLGVGAVPGGIAAHAHAHLPGSAPGYFGRALLTQTMSAVTAACLAVTRGAFEAVGGLDESLAVAFNDVDFCLRLREAGYTNIWTPHAVLLHHESASRGYEDTPEKHARFVTEVDSMIARWGASFDRDPAYNPNLALTPKEFTIDPDRFARI